MFEESIKIMAPYLMFIIGAYMGSFAYTIILRWPEGETFLLSWSKCPHCQKQLTWYDNIPLLSWIFLKGRCRSCSYKISFEYFFMEIFMACFFLALYWHVGFEWKLIEYALFLSALTAATVIDFKHFLIPDILTLSGICFGLIGAMLNPERAFLDSFMGLLLGGGFFWLSAWVYFILRKEEGLGGGDIKLLAWIGTIFGWQSIPVIILLSSFFGIIIGIIMKLKNQQDSKVVIPFGPFLAVSSIFYIFGENQYIFTSFLPFWLR